MSPNFKLNTDEACMITAYSISVYNFHDNHYKQLLSLSHRAQKTGRNQG